MNHPFLLTHSTKKDGNMSFLYGDHQAVIENREKFLLDQGITMSECVALRTEHGTKIETVDVLHAGRGITNIESAVYADALITTDPKIALFLLTADCLPITFFDHQHRVIALAHLSRDNSSLNFSQKILDVFSDKFQSNIADLTITIGPSIHQESYHKDLLGENVEQLISKGIKKENIVVNNTDTFLSQDHFSHHRSVITGEAEGRFATVVKLGK